MAFCPKCGKKDIKGVFCKDCTNDEIGYKQISVKQCPECNKIHHKGLWRKQALEHHVAEKLRKQFNYRTLRISETKDGIELVVDDKYFLPAGYVNEICPECSRLKSRYFEAILQLRNESIEALDFVRTFLKKSGKANISKEVRVRNGYDFYITSNNAAKGLAKALNANFGGFLKENYHLHTRDRQTSKDVYRSHILFRMLSFRKGDVIIVGRNPVLVRSTGEKITGFDLKRSKNVSFEPKDYEMLDIIKTSVTKVKPVIEILDPESYDSVPTENSGDVRAGEKVKAVKHDGKFYLL
ncbi:hypothetical protein JW968_06445 [Candidatus Woesearchaeota archaeon]|nr:hypothetical protein [Candidatus Woesearchaeota archaeon]